MAGQNYWETNIKCPFFHSMKQTGERGYYNFLCEGITDETETLRRFKDTLEIAEHVKSICNNKYATCPVYCTLMILKYSDYYSEFRKKDGTMECFEYQNEDT